MNEENKIEVQSWFEKFDKKRQKKPKGVITTNIDKEKIPQTKKISIDEKIEIEKFSHFTDASKSQNGKPVNQKPLTIGPKCQIIGPIIHDEYVKELYDNTSFDPSAVVKNKSPMKVPISLTKDKDPFNRDDQTKWIPRYFASICRLLYDPSVTYMEGNKKVYVNQFHSRGLYYRIISEGICVPIFTLSQSKEQAKESGANTPIYELVSPNEFISRKSSKELDTLINDSLSACRFGNLIDWDQVIDLRIKDGIKPNDFIDMNENQTQITYNPNYKLHLSLETPLKARLNTPIVFLFTEKGELRPIFERLSKNYVLSYYVGTGQMSNTGIKDLYNFFKSHGKVAIVLTMSDFDESGVVISTNIATKLQWFWLHDSQTEEKDRPHILFHNFLLGNDDVEEILIKGNLQAVIKKEFYGAINLNPRKYKCLKIIELAALESLVGKKGYEKCHNLYDIIEQKLIQLLQINKTTTNINMRGEQINYSLIDKVSLDKQINYEKGELEKKLLNNINILTQDRQFDSVTQYIDETTKKFEQTPEYRILVQAQNPFDETIYGQLIERSHNDPILRNKIDGLEDLGLKIDPIVIKDLDATIDSMKKYIEKVDANGKAIDESMKFINISNPNYKEVVKEIQAVKGLKEKIKIGDEKTIKDDCQTIIPKASIVKTN